MLHVGLATVLAETTAKPPKQIMRKRAPCHRYCSFGRRRSLEGSANSVLKLDGVP